MKKITWTAAFAALALTLSACGGGNPTPDNPNETIPGGNSVPVITGFTLSRQSKSLTVRSTTTAACTFFSSAGNQAMTANGITSDNLYNYTVSLSGRYDNSYVVCKNSAGSSKPYNLGTLIVG